MKAGFLAVFTFASGLPLNWLAGCGESPEANAHRRPSRLIAVTSSSFEPGGRLPRRLGKAQGNVPPQLSWSEGPPGTTSYVVLCLDLDSPPELRVRWLVHRIPPTVRGIWENSTTMDIQRLDARTGKGYDGPDPPSGVRWRCAFRVYALRMMPKAPEGAGWQDLLREIRGQAIGRGEVTGVYEGE